MPLEEQGLAEDSIVAERVWLEAAMRLQRLVSVHVLPRVPVRAYAPAGKLEKSRICQLPNMLVAR
ncbi:MAG: hypothetical protein IVW55_17105 [Chloroflexi bacterium]|nr:hypothetical protein [Chloroflexota bacterium]